MMQTSLPLAVIENKMEYKAVKKPAVDWDDIEVKPISEVLVAVEVQIHQSFLII